MFALAIVFLVASAITLFVVTREVEPPQPPITQPEAKKDPLDSVLSVWKADAPQVVIALTGEMHGYLEPCGCSRPQVGGLERRYELFARLQLALPGLSFSRVDLGDLMVKQVDGTQYIEHQTTLKFETTLQALKAMDYRGIGLGFGELSRFPAPLDLSLNHQPPTFLAANVDDAQLPSKLDDKLYYYKPFVIDEVGKFKIAYVGLVGSGVVKKARERNNDPSLAAFQEWAAPLQKTLGEPQVDQADVRVLVFQGKLDEAKELAAKFPKFDIILCQDLGDQASRLPLHKEGKTIFVGLGHKGRAVGLVGVHPEPDGIRCDYQMVELAEYLELPKDKTNPVRDLIKGYVRNVHSLKEGGKTFLEQWHKTPHPVNAQAPGATYVGSEKCKDCHQKAYATWSGSKHSKAYDALVNYTLHASTIEKEGKKLSIGRQYDPDCVRCHTTGFNHVGGFVDEVKTPQLVGNGCENCHGPGSKHVADAKNPDYFLSMRLNHKTAEQTLCRKCHDLDNDPHFDLDKYWAKVKHTRD
jgi:hypothetical protein